MVKTATTACPLLKENCTVESTIEKLQNRIAELTEQLHIDELTGLFNKRHLNGALLGEMERTKRHKYPVSITIFDLDHFKMVNDTYGHPAGDLVLKTVADVVQANLRISDIPCRFGGEEFVIILPSTPLLLAAQAAERLRSAIASEMITLPGQDKKLNVTASFGVAGYLPMMRETPEFLVERADQQLYLAKQNGRNQVQYEPIADTAKTQISAEEKDALYKGFQEDP